ncbi:Ribosome biogenesis protein Urb1 [Taphrina deformans PYCC 5710]|uniref:Ribosome biogenesis protein Urb1 n=1 Tax=Taphrina deformans (strain PYCC 5710 / ATCC 11124 / CBS 356.35 / IMI 108563 / JCM 9778 / NBRC 8474) TaxID=1097556 RepID=R4XCM0_TAPDE|nr:Ribosome biogenesis protein Urb1 [Taphrina deformans PYCC 5710]|eukprot:CCG83571.1 Ribosome biogenesis protein Urb1 [Taphrina deformans PYCC 5710]
MPPHNPSAGSSVVTSLQDTLAKDDGLEELHQYISEGTHLDLSAAWTTAVQTNDSTASTAICKAISQVLIKVDGERGFASSGSAFIRRVLAEHARSILRNLSSLRPMYVNPTLRLLITMAQFDAGALSNDVYLALDFSTFKVLPKLLTRTGPQTQKPKDEKVTLGKRKRDDHSSKDAMRGLFIALLFTLLNRAPTSARADIIQRRPIIQELVKHLPTDSDESIIKTLKGFKTLIENREISRPAKIQCFNESILTQLSALYSRPETGDQTEDVEMTEETETPDHDSNEQSPDGDSTVEAVDDVLTSSPVRKALQEFFLVATTVPDQGVCFASKGLIPPANKKLYNPILGSFILTLDIDDELQADLLGAILRGTPELIAPWTQGTKVDYTPCLEQSWILRMKTLEMIAPGELSPGTVSNLGQIPNFVILENIIPTPLAKVATKGLQHESPLVQLMTCRTLSKCLAAFSFIRDLDDDRTLEIIEQAQKRAPLVEIILPLTTVSVSADTPEVEVLLRREAITILELYVSAFTDLPSFDFVKLFDMIINARVSSPPGMAPDSTLAEHGFDTLDDNEDDVDDEDDDDMEDEGMTDILTTKKNVDCTYATILEQLSVLRMARHLDGVPWLTKRRGTRSMLGNVLNYMSDATHVAGALASRVLWKIAVADSIAFSTTSPTVVCPESKFVAFVKAFPPEGNVPAESSQMRSIVEFVEDCMIRFQASPYKYWDQFTDLCIKHDLNMNCDLSLILFTFQEQLEFVTEKAHIQRWYEEVLSELVGVGEDKSICEALLGHPLPESKLSQEHSLWNAVKVAFAIYRGGISDEELDPDESYTDGNDSDVEWTRESGESLLDLHWSVILNSSSEMDNEEARKYKDFLVDLWTTKSEMSSSEAAEMLTVITNWFEKSDTAHNNKLNALIERLLLLSETSILGLQDILTTQQVHQLTTRLLNQSRELPSSVKASLLDGFVDVEESTASTALFGRMFSADDFYHEYVLRSLTNAIQRKSLQAFPLQDYICTGNDAVRANRAKELDPMYLVEAETIAECISAYLTHYEVQLVPANFIKWATSVSFEDAALVISRLLLSSRQEQREIGLRVLEEQCVDINALLKGRKSSAVLQCIRAKIGVNTDTQVHLIKNVLEHIDTSKLLDNMNMFDLLSALQAGTCENLDSETSSQLSSYHVKLVEYLTRQFAENRVQENKYLDGVVLRNLSRLGGYLQDSTRFLADVGKPMIDTMVMAAVENQLRKPEVLELLIGIAKSTPEDAYNYTRTVQAVLSQSLLLETEEVQLISIKLLHILILHNPSQANLNVMDEILKLYTGTLVTPDLLLFDILCSLEQSLKVSLGSRMKSWRLVESLKETTIDRSKTDAVVSSEIAQFTISHFAEHDTIAPTELRMKNAIGADALESLYLSSGEEEAMVRKKPTEAGQIYDLRYIVPLIAGYMHADPSFSMLKQLIDHHAAGLAFLGLASKDPTVRQQSSRVLSKFDSMIQSSTIREKAQLSTIFQVVKNSISAASIQESPIPLIHAVFLGHATHMMLVPSHFLYEKMNRFLLARPQLDFTDVPMFLNLFNSHEGYVKHVIWIVKLLASGLRGNREESGQSYGRRHVLEMCMGLYNAKTASTRIKEAIRGLLRECVGSVEMKWYFERVGGPTWLAMTDDEALEEIRDVFRD